MSRLLLPRRALLGGAASLLASEALAQVYRPGGGLAPGFKSGFQFLNAGAAVPAFVPSINGTYASAFYDFTQDQGYSGGQQLASSTSDLSISRASVGYDQAGTMQFAANAFRRTSAGLLIEEARTNLVLNSFTPATQTIAVTNGTKYTISCSGTGSTVLSGAGTGTASAGSPVIFTASGTSLTLTVSGSLNWMQCEAGAFATSPIPTTTSAVTRAADAVSASGSSLLSAIQSGNASIIFEISGIPNGAFAPCLFSGNGGNTVLTTNGGASTTFDFYTGADLNSSSLNATIGPNKVGISYGAVNSKAISVNGSAAATATSASGLTTGSIYIGSQSGTTRYQNTVLRKLTIYSRVLTSAELQQVTT